ncbi:CAF1 family ribonuclease, putative [Entamoeba histolytica HM-1:IMSS-B]|uniref:poly(A)-specific ribonuclease n=6 Tax=Entamoeba histolytica TaxID=5759 RepID=C4LZS1_ENTH1|nr:CAF1 family ribonuclease, putative [Entamoeba histolytica HM-1:IMSS]EMD44893.1 CAF1 family ribonuclease [Entamoeba histolytica KU27]EMH76851.1 CAF1 family ribonuclease, putative [Entamoeba histolytica HM-1:IMSS-B]EMS15069.1 CAF1 family ribonuclease [Entamoeba histolytica HM-3:IMSS]ENY65718.1 CAF1 family ribonuclease, putative [Entamoeba histolytica HM-1:IMSS-A]GAT94377.1 caf1 family ribonuclease putative [Entamoeba histolytica]|eukprot:XP_656835.1 CAF1 family ribonuclease, putative [Entamoeba histolytica HM-1:IMSS]
MQSYNGMEYPFLNTSHFYPPFSMQGFAQLSQGQFSSYVFQDVSFPNNYFIDVYQNNLQEEMMNISRLIDDFPYVSMDTEFPGFSSRTSCNMQDSAEPEEHYSFLKGNVDELKIIQVGITLQNKRGEYPEGVRTWQFNFKFDPDKDECSADSIQLLQKAGINFPYFKNAGITEEDFGETIMTSGLVLNENTHWLTFHSGYDFGYLLRLLTCEKLPSSIDDFFTKLCIFFPNIIDLKHVTNQISQTYHGSLQAIASSLGVQRIGTMHQAGSDSLITGGLYFKLKEKHPDFDDDRFNGILFGLNDE